MGTANHLPSFSLTGPQNTMMHSVPTGLFFVTLLSLGHCASSPRSGQAPKDAAAAVWIQVISLHRSDAPPTPTKGSTTEIHGSPGSWFTVGERQQSTSKHTWEEPELAKVFDVRLTFGLCRTTTRAGSTRGQHLDSQKANGGRPVFGYPMVLQTLFAVSR